MALTDTAWFPWVTAFLGLAVTGILVFAAWWALFADRPRGRRRCPRCWYDLTYSPGMRCGECGFTARRDADFNRTRRRTFIALLAIVGSTAMGAYLIDDMGSRGWLTYVPSRALVWALPVSGDAGRPLLDELDARRRRGLIDDELALAVIRRCATGDPGAKAPSALWQQKYALQLSRWVGRFDEAEEAIRDEIEALLLAIPPDVALSVRSAWPAEVPVTVEVQARDWWPREVQLRITATTELPGATPDVHVRLDDPIQPRSYSLMLPPLAEGTHDVPIAFAFERRLDEGDPWTPLPGAARRLRVRIAAPEVIGLEAVDDPDLDAAIREAFSVGLTRWSSGSLPVRVGLRVRPTLVDLFDDTAVGVRIDVLHDGKLGRQLDIWWRAGTDALERQYAWEVPWWDDAVLSAPDVSDRAWAVRVRGLPEIALRVDGMRRYWAGDLTIPVRVRDRDGAAPARGWRPETPPGAVTEGQRPTR